MSVFRSKGKYSLRKSSLTLRKKKNAKSKFSKKVFKKEMAVLSTAVFHKHDTYM